MNKNFIIHILLHVESLSIVEILWNKFCRNNKCLFVYSTSATVIKNAKTFGVNSLVETAQASNTQGIPMTYKLIGVSPNPAGTNSYFSIDPSKCLFTVIWWNSS